MNTHSCAITRTNLDGLPKDSFTCFSHTSLLKLAENINKINGSIVINTSRYPRNKKYELYKLLTKHMAKYCDNKDETCWASQEFVDDQYTREMTFKPIIPKEKYGWLSSLDLLAIGKQYETFCDQVHSDPNNPYQKFHFLGVYPIDFESIDDYMQTLSIRKLIKKGYKHIAMILNLDKHNQPGSHWVAYFLDLSKDVAQQYYYDSVANKPPFEVYTFANRVQKKLKKLNIPTNEKMPLIFNRIKSQFKNSECGVYSWMCIQRLLEGKTWYEVTSNVIYDDAMNLYRLSLFRQPSGFNPSKFHYVLD